jgi:hypothetical protein
MQPFMATAIAWVSRGMMLMNLCSDDLDRAIDAKVVAMNNERLEAYENEAQAGLCSTVLIKQSPYDDMVD